MNDFNLVDELLAKHFSGETLTQKEKAILEEWQKMHASEYERILQIMQAPLLAEEGFNSKRAWEKVAPQLTDTRKIKQQHSKRISWFTYSIVASLLLLITLSFFFIWKDKAIEPLQYANHTANEQRIYLPDSSEVILFPQSELTYMQKAAELQRNVNLKGKAFFMVRQLHGIPFTVTTQELQVKVLGTSFLVDVSRREQQAVYVETGKVQVHMNEYKEVLTANEKVKVSHGKMQKSTIQSPEKIFGQRGKILYFNHTPLPEVIQTLKRKSGLIIELEEGLENNMITTQIDIEKSEEIITELAFLCRCQYDILLPGKHYKLHNPQP